MNKVLIGIFFVAVFLSLTVKTLAIDIGVQKYNYYRISAVGTNPPKYGIKNIFGINISDFSPNKPSLSLTVWGNDTIKKYNGDGWLSGSGYLINPLTNPITQVFYSIKLTNITNCTNFSPTRIFCNGTGVFLIEFKNSSNIPQIIKPINIFLFDLNDSNGNGTIGIGDTINLAGGGTSSDDLFNITLIIPNISMKIRTPFINTTIMSGIQVQYSDYGMELTFPEPLYTGQTLYATNNVIIKNIGKFPLNVSVCEEDFPGLVEFKIKKGVEIGNFVPLPACNSTISLGLLDPSKKIQMYVPKITYTSDYDQGTLEFFTELK